MQLAFTKKPDFEVVKSRSINVPIGAVYHDRKHYEDYPPFQRDKVWKSNMKRELVESILQGMYVPAILVCNRPPDSRGYWVVDGQQRLSTIMEVMEIISGDRVTAKKYTPADPRPFNFPMSEAQRERFRDYPLTFIILEEVTEKQLGVMFRRLQNQVPLTTAEKLWSYTSETTKQALNLSTHDFYEQLYTGKTNRKQTFQASMYPVIIQMQKPFGDMSANMLHTFARGGRDDLISSGMADELKTNMNYVSWLFQGVRMAAMTELIIMYQAVWLLRFIGCDLDACEPGALCSWYAEVERLNNEYRTNGFMNLFAQMPRKKFQKQFWLEHLPKIVYGNHVVLGDPNRVYMQMQRVIGWIKNDGICKQCNEQHVKLLDVERHAFRPGDERACSPLKKLAV